MPFDGSATPLDITRYMTPLAPAAEHYAYDAGIIGGSAVS